jgi:hypothetical protein
MLAEDSFIIEIAAKLAGFEIMRRDYNPQAKLPKPGVRRLEPR